MRRNYPAYIHKDPTSDFGVSFPDFDGVITAGSTLTEAMELAEEALALHIAGILEDGVDLPEPSEVDLQRIPDRDSFICVALVPAVVPGKPKRVNVMLDSNLLTEIDAHTKNRSAFLAAAARDALRKAG